MRSAETATDRNLVETSMIAHVAHFIARFNLRETAQTLSITLGAILASMVLFGIYALVRFGVSPIRVYHYMYVGSFGSNVSFQNSLLAAAPLILTALCCALPARVGLIVIGGDGALALGGLAAAIVGLAMEGGSLPVVLVSMALAGMVAGGLLIALAGWLRYARGVNETISSLMLSLIAIGIFNYIVEGPLRDPNPISANKPSTPPIAELPLVGKLFGDVHWGLGLGIIYCVVTYVLMYRTTFGFAARMVGGNVRAAQAAGLSVGKLLLVTCLLGGAAAGLAGMVEVVGVQLQANASLLAGYGLTGVLVSFIARHNPLAIIPVALLFGGLSESSGVLQRYIGANDASVEVLKGIMFVTIIFSETFYGRFRIFLPREVQKAMAK